MGRVPHKVPQYTVPYPDSGPLSLRVFCLGPSRLAFGGAGATLEVHLPASLGTSWLPLEPDASDPAFICVKKQGVAHTGGSRQGFASGLWSDGTQGVGHGCVVETATRWWSFAFWMWWVGFFAGARGAEPRTESFLVPIAARRRAWPGTFPLSAPSSSGPLPSSLPFRAQWSALAGAVPRGYLLLALASPPHYCFIVNPGMVCVPTQQDLRMRSHHSTRCELTDGLWVQQVPARDRIPNFLPKSLKRPRLGVTVLELLVAFLFSAVHRLMSQLLAVASHAGNVPQRLGREFRRSTGS